MKRDLVTRTTPQGIYAETVDDRDIWQYTEIATQEGVTRFSLYTYRREENAWTVKDTDCEGLLVLSDHTNELTPREAQVDITALREKYGVTGAPMALPLPGR